MHHHPERPLTDLERRLAGWTPAPSGLDRDRLLYESGRAAARSERRFTASRLALAVLLVVSLIQGGLLVREHHRRRGLERTLARLAESDAPVAVGAGHEPVTRVPETALVVGSYSYLALSRQLVASHGAPDPVDGDGERPRDHDPSHEETSPLRAFSVGRSFNL